MIFPSRSFLAKSKVKMPFYPRMKKNGRKDLKKKRGGPKDDDVDSRGNAPGLIDYDYESSDSSDGSSTSSDESLTKSELYALKKHGHLPKSVKKGIRRPKRLAAIEARKKIEKQIAKENRSSDGSFRENTFRQRRRKGVVESSEEESSEDGETLGSEDTWSEEEEAPRRRRTKKEESSEEEEDDEDVSEEEEDEDEDVSEEEEEDDEDDEKKGFQGLSIIFGGGGAGGGGTSMIPRRHNMKKESEDVRKFVKLLTRPMQEDTIDDQIDQFKSLDAAKQKIMLQALEHRSDYAKKEQPLMFRLLQMKLEPDTMGMVMSRYNSLSSMDPSSGEYYKLRNWMEKLVSMPLGLYKEMPVRIEDGSAACTPFMEKARRCLDDAIYGQDEAKLQIQQFIASKIANPTASGLSLLLIGPPGIGKTSLIKNGIAKALAWPFQFISLGGDSDATTYTGHQFVYEGSHSGKIANCLAAAKSMSLVMMFDELDKVSATPKGEEVQNLLVHLTDPVQNMDFEDKYLSGIPLDLSRVMFVFSANDINKIDKILLDRMIVVQLQGYEKKDKIEIAEKFLLPEALKEVNLAEKVAWSKEVLQHILDNYASEETGVRELKRCIGQIAQRINMLRMFNVKELPFHIPGFSLPFVLKKEHVDLFLKKKDHKEKVPFGMYA